MTEPPDDQSLPDAVAERLRAAIWSGVYQPGDRLVERRLAAEFGVSHIPLREALTRLTKEGLVERLPRRGARVARLTPRRLEEITSLRVVLEQFAVRRIAARFGPADRDRLQQVVDEMKQAAAADDLIRLQELDSRFHQRLWQLADHALLVETAAQVRSRTSHFYRASATSLGRDEIRRYADTHQELLDVIAAGDIGAAEAAIAAHIQLASRRIAGAQFEGEG